MSDNKDRAKLPANIASVRLPAKVLEELRAAVALRETTVQEVLEQAVRVYLAATDHR